jgi:hypothetical protein
MEIDLKGGVGPQTLAALRDLGGTYVAVFAGLGAAD